MTEEKKSSQINYISTESAEVIYRVFYERFLEIGEPIEPYRVIDKSKIENVIEMPKAQFAGLDLYPTLSDKAAFIFYEINKGHIFPNGNKRLSVAFLLFFLVINDMEMNVTPNELTAKALEIAMSPANDFESVKKELKDWISSKLVKRFTP